MTRGRRRRASVSGAARAGLGDSQSRGSRAPQERRLAASLGAGRERSRAIVDEMRCVGGQEGGWARLVRDGASLELEIRDREVESRVRDLRSREVRQMGIFAGHRGRMDRLGGDGDGREVEGIA